MKKKLFKIIACICVCLIALPCIFLNNTLAETYNSISSILLGTNVTGDTTGAYNKTYILNNEYYGHVNVQYKKTNSIYTTKTIYVNGSEFTVDNMYLANTSVSFNSVNLKSNNNNNNNYSFPIESIGFVDYVSTFASSVTSYHFGDYIYPFYKLKAGTSFYGYSIRYLTFGSNTNIPFEKFNDYFSVTNGTLYDSQDLIVSENFYVRTYYFNSTATNTITVLKDINIMPIYIGNDYNIRFCSDTFLKNFGLVFTHNDDDLNDEANNNFSESANQFNDLENTFNSDLDTNLNNIDTSISTDSFGAKFLASAVFVRNCFDWLTADTPFESLITFSLTLGLALLIIGKALT